MVKINIKPQENYEGLQTEIGKIDKKITQAKESNKDLDVKVAKDNTIYTVTRIRFSKFGEQTIIDAVNLKVKVYNSSLEKLRAKVKNIPEKGIIEYNPITKKHTIKSSNSDSLTKIDAYVNNIRGALQNASPLLNPIKTNAQDVSDQISFYKDLTNLLDALKDPATSLGIRREAAGKLGRLILNDQMAKKHVNQERMSDQMQEYATEILKDSIAQIISASFKHAGSIAELEKIKAGAGLSDLFSQFQGIRFHTGISYYSVKTYIETQIDSYKKKIELKQEKLQLNRNSDILRDLRLKKQKIDSELSELEPIDHAKKTLINNVKFLEQKMEGMGIKDKKIVEMLKSLVRSIINGSSSPKTLRANQEKIEKMQKEIEKRLLKKPKNLSELNSALGLLNMGYIIITQASTINDMEKQIPNFNTKFAKLEVLRLTKKTNDRLIQDFESRVQNLKGRVKQLETLTLGT